MARPAGMMAAPQRAALQRARESRKPFTAKEFYGWLQDAGARNVSPNSTTGYLMHLVQMPGASPDNYRPLIIAQQGRRGPGGSTSFQYAFDGDPGIASKKASAAAGEGGEGTPKGDKNMAFRGSARPEDKPYYDRRAQIQNRAPEPSGSNELSQAYARLEQEFTKAGFKQFLARLEPKSLEHAVNIILQDVPDEFQSDAMMIVKAMKGHKGPPSKRAGFEPGESEKPSKARDALAKFMANAPEEDEEEPSDYDVDDMGLGPAGAATEPAPRREPQKKAEPEPEPTKSAKPDWSKADPDDLDPGEDEDGEPIGDDEDEGEFGEPDEGEFEDEPIPQWMPDPNADGDRAERGMATLEKAGVSASDPVWKEILNAGSDMDVHKVLRMNKSIPAGLMNSAIQVAKHIWKMNNKDWDKSESWKRAAYGRIIK